MTRQILDCKLEICLGKKKLGQEDQLGLIYQPYGQGVTG